MSKAVATDFNYVTALDAAPDPHASAGAQAYPQTLLDLPPGEARKSLLAVHETLSAKLPPGRLAIYEAGGGSTSFLPLGIWNRAHVTVVDIDADQIRNNDYAQEKILGDVQTYRFKHGSFDLVICYNVIEHLPDVRSALLGFCEALKQDGLILIGAPNPNSLSGIVTKHTPHWFHVWFYRYVLGDKKAGLPGEAPFPTFFHPLVTPARLDAFARDQGLEVIYRKEYESPRFPEMRSRKPMFAGLLDLAANAMNFLLLKRADVRHGDYHVILRKR
jgi:SAM-dependent methyltransferase